MQSPRTAYIHPGGPREHSSASVSGGGKSLFPPNLTRELANHLNQLEAAKSLTTAEGRTHETS